MRWNIGSSSASTSTLDAGLPPNHPAIAGSSKPPASCPMHTADTPAAPPKPTSAPAKCPVDHAAMAAAGKKPAAALAGAAAAGSTGGLAKCPVQHDKPSDLNPLNHIPKELSAVKQPGQTMDLPTDRTASSIPRPKDAQGQDEGDVWDYPSPQQFYNALVRKGWETPEESIETVVAIHNWLNEVAWEEVMKWERRVPGGGSAQLSKFQGRPGELSPKAQFFLWAGKIFPSKFNSEPPFDRHDWVVTRPAAGGVSARYVIDYYSAPPDAEGNPQFSLDVRPALDSLESINQRIRVGLEEWMKGEGQ
ncbi:putative pyruvate carboxylase isoform [Papiliotrema laurentii]|uniref:Holocytochrome c-type synthase n=1 Tax=Papiliotrema laurentii TaxID=5418 RepID=A0AAD9FMZ5_PAPLA|nr:putative pyruvate carboxylase isoform [Papiliotrema laurentii]